VYYKTSGNQNQVPCASLESVPHHMRNSMVCVEFCG
jgi:hypothetical protein